MRLIDADAFDQVLEAGELEAQHNRKYVFASALNTIRGNLRKAPTIEPKQKVGKWLPRPSDLRTPWECSECGYRVNLEDGGIYRFCEACGARMTEGEA